MVSTVTVEKGMSTVHVRHVIEEKSADLRSKWHVMSHVYGSLPSGLPFPSFGPSIKLSSMAMPPRREQLQRLTQLTGRIMNLFEQYERSLKSELVKVPDKHEEEMPAMMVQCFWSTYMHWDDESVAEMHRQVDLHLQHMHSQLINIIEERDQLFADLCQVPHDVQ